MWIKKCAVVSTTTLALALAGCSSNDEDPSDPGSDRSSAPAISTDPTSAPTSDATDPPTDDLTSDAEGTAATGQQIVLTSGRTKVLTFNLPEADWRLSRGGLAANLHTSDGAWRIDSNAVKSFDTTTLDFLARGTQQYFRSMSRKVERLPNRTVDGAEGYVLEGSDADHLGLEFGSIYQGWTISLRFDVPARAPMAREWIESVLASVTWL